MFAALLSGLLLGLSAGLAPGPLTALLLSETLHHGRRAGLKIACVPLLSDPPVILLVLLLFSRLSDFAPLLGTLSLAGGLFVAHLSWERLGIRPSALAVDRSPPSSLRQGIIANLLNPHPYLFWITVGAPLMFRSASLGAAALFAASFYFCLVGTKIALALLVAGFRDLLVNRFYLLLNRLLGLLLLAFALLLLRDGLRLFGLV